jgi:hypothetical protein
MLIQQFVILSEAKNPMQAWTIHGSERAPATTDQEASIGVIFNYGS